MRDPKFTSISVLVDLQFQDPLNRDKCEAGAMYLKPILVKRFSRADPKFTSISVLVDL